MCFVCGAGSSYGGRVHPASLSVRNEIYLEWHPEFVLWHTYWFGDGRRCRVETDNMQLLEQLIEQDEYWSVLPKSAALSMEGRMDVRILPIEDGPEDRVVYLLLKHKKTVRRLFGSCFRCLRNIWRSWESLWIGEGKI